MKRIYLFTAIFFQPTRQILFYGILPLPGFIYGILFLAYSHYMGKKSIDNIGHEAHFTGAIFGFLFPIFLDTELISIFINNF